jgi:Kelch motif protein
VRSRRLAPLALLLPLLAGCGSGSPGAGPVPPASIHAQDRSTKPKPAAPTTATAHQSRWRLPYRVARAALISLRAGSVILAGGLLPDDTSTARVLRLDLATGRSGSLPSLLLPVHDTAGGMVAGRPTVVGGGNATEQPLVQTLAHGRWIRGDALPSARSDLATAQWRRHVYVVGGYDGASSPRGVLRLSPRAAPDRAGDLLHGVRYAAVARVGSDLFVFGGEAAGRELDTIQRVDLTTGQVRPAGRLPHALGHAMVATVGGRVLVMGGRVTPGAQTDAMWWYDPTTGRVRQAGRLPSAISDAAVAVSGRHVWLLGGETPSITDRVVEVTAR